MARRRRSGRQVALLVAALLLFLSLTPVAAGASLTLTPTSGQAGDTVVAQGSSYPLNAPISVRWDATLVATGTATSRVFTIPFQVPLTATPGPHVVTMCVTGSGVTGCSTPIDTAIFAVVLPPPPTPIPGPTATPLPTIPPPIFPLGGETPTPEPPPLVAVTPAPTPPNQVGSLPDDFPDLWIKAIEVTQGVQDLLNRMPLVEDRRTYARVYVGVIGESSWPNTYGALEARRNGQQVGWIWPENGPIIARLGAGSRVEIDDSLYFRLPQSWLHGEVTLRAFVYSYATTTVFDAEPVWQNNLSAVDVAFHPAQPLTVHLAPLHMHRSFHPDDVERTYDPDLDADLLPPGGSATLRVVHGLYRHHPLAQVNLDLFTAPITPIGHGDGHEFNMGGCQTILVEQIAGNHLVIADWEPLMEEPAKLEPEAQTSYEADRPTLRYLDRTFEIDSWDLVDDGVSVWGSSSGVGPQPLPGTPVFVDGCKPDPSTAAEPNQLLALYRLFYDWDAEGDLFVGMVHSTLPTHFGGLSTTGTDSVWVRMNDLFSNSSPWYHSAAAILGHEAAHAPGLKHVPCADGNDDDIPDETKGGAIDPSHPNALTFPHCSLADVDPEGYYGFDVYGGLFGQPGPTVISNNPAQAAPNRAFPLLSYASPKGPDPYHWCRLLDFYGVPCDPTDLGIPWSEPDAPAGGPLTVPPNPQGAELPPGATGLIGLRGSFDPQGFTPHMEVDYISEAPTPSAMRRYAGQYVVAEARHFLVVLDSDGNELASVPIQQQDAGHADNATISFQILVPYFPDAHVYQLRSTDHDFVRVEVSPNAPTVSWEPISRGADTLGRVKLRLPWTASDADGDALTYTLLYAPDGEHWQVLGAALPEPTFEVFLDTLPGGDGPVFKVIALDGTRAASALSEPMEPLVGLPPTVGLGMGAGTYPLGASVLLTASAFDAEDRALPGEAIAWSSSLDGELGSGSELVAEGLSAGTHTISATVTDSDGLTDTASVELVVDPAVTQDAPDPDVEAAVDDLFAALAAGEDPSAAGGAPAPSDPTPLLLVVVGIGAIALAAVGGIAWRSRRRAGPGGAG